MNENKIVSWALVLIVVYLLAYFFVIAPLQSKTAVRNNENPWPIVGKIVNPENHTGLVNGGQADTAKEGDNISITWNPTKT